MRTARLVFLTLVAVALGAATVAAASSLTTASGEYGAGGAAVESCDPTGAISTTYTVSSGKVTEVILSNIPPACAGGSVHATLTNNGTSVATTHPKAVPNDGSTSLTLTVTNPSSSNVTDVYFVIVGP